MKLRKYKVEAQIDQVTHRNLVLAVNEEEAVRECEQVYGYTPELVKDLS